MKGMSVEQANYCDNLKVGNISTWIKDCSALELVDEYHLHTTNKLPRMSFFEMVENKDIATQVCDEWISNAIGISFEPANLDLNLLSTITEIDQVKADTGINIGLDRAVDFEEDAVNVTKHALQKLSSN